MKLSGAKNTKQGLVCPSTVRTLHSQIYVTESRYCCSPLMYLFEEDVVHYDHGGQVGVGAPHHSELRRLSRT